VYSIICNMYDCTVLFHVEVIAINRILYIAYNLVSYYVACLVFVVVTLLPKICSMICLCLW